MIPRPPTLAASPFTKIVWNHGEVTHRLRGPVVMAVFNGEAHVSEAIGSILGQWSS
jgi:hypothetical protein